ncbi:MAG: hypothetical protein ABI605_03765, partial [Rhizobacter sp.]
MKLTKTAVEKFKCPPGKTQAFLWDDTPRGFGVRCTSTGAKSYIVVEFHAILTHLFHPILTHP